MEIDLLFSPPATAAYKSQNPASRPHFLFFSIKNDKLYLLKPLARSLALGSQPASPGEEERERLHPPDTATTLLGMNKCVINCVGVAAKQRQGPRPRHP